MSLQPFFSYFGGKWRLAPRYPKPVHDTIIEPFAGSAGYATRYHSRKVILVERDPHIAALWRWLIGASARDVMALPEDPEQAKGEGRTLIEFNLSRSLARHGQRRRQFQRGFHEHTSVTWCRAVRARIAMQVDKIRHWRVIEGTYADAPDVEADWFIDPPYEDLGRYYTHGAEGIDFAHLAGWCRARRGQVIVCESLGARWLPFRAFPHARSDDRPEAIWTNDPVQLAERS